MNMPGGSRPGGTNGAGLPGATGGPVAPGHGGGTGSFDVTEALSAGPLGGNGTGNGTSGTGNGTTDTGNGVGGPEPRHDDLPYFTEPGPAAPNGAYAGPRAPPGPPVRPAPPAARPPAPDG
ncbi:Peptidoglycan binding domain-containing protein OS=Streptomyces fumanus OX=67302 GN=GCM10018772_49210 PE=4 SV=1 [Streptomyces fumanus]